MSTVIRIAWALLFIALALFVWRRFFAGKVL